ncbi:MAG: hypothetical protein AAB392_01545 [Patescibacteria group bacterium]
MKNFYKKQAGFSLFIAVTVAGVLTIVAFTVTKIVTKSVEYANIGKSSQIAFFAADAGVECALYYDSLEPSKFATSSSGSPISCAGVSMATSNAISGTSTTMRIGGGGDSNPTSYFGFTLNQGANPLTACVIVSVNKSYVGQILRTRVSSFGYNTCDTTSSRRIERGLEVTY